MTDKSARALELRTQGKTFAQIGQALGITRQAAQYQVRRGMAFATASNDDALARSLTQENFAPSDPVGGDVPPVSVGVRQAIDPDVVIGARRLPEVVAIMREALTGGDTRPLFRLYREIERRDPNYRSVKETRVNQVAALPIRVSPGGSLARDRRVAEWIEGQLRTETFQQAVPMLLEGTYDGVSVCPFKLRSEGAMWVLDDMTQIDPAHLVFSKRDGRTLYVLPQEYGQPPALIDRNTVVTHYAKKSGLAVAGGLALAAVFAYVLKWMATKNWASLLAVYGKAVKVGKYKAGTKAGDIRALRNAVGQLGSDAAAVIVDTMTVEFLKDATAGGSADMFERFIRYMDECLAKLFLGASLTTGTSNTGAGGSQALGVVHAELRIDIMRADAKALGYSVQHLVNILTIVNFGADVPPPTAEFVIEEPEDTVALANVALSAQRMGLRLSARGLAERLGLPLADEDDPNDVLVPLPVDPAPNNVLVPREPKVQATSHEQGASFAAGAQSDGGGRDTIDEMADTTDADWQSIGGDIQSTLTLLVKHSHGLDDLRLKLSQFVAAILPAPVDQL